MCECQLPCPLGWAQTPSPGRQMVRKCTALGGAWIKGATEPSELGEELPLCIAAATALWVPYSCPLKVLTPLLNFGTEELSIDDLDSWHHWSLWPLSIPQCLFGTELRPSYVCPLLGYGVCSSC